MPHARYFFPHPLSQGDIISLSSEEEKHLLKVMRTEPGQIVEIVNGQGQLANASLQKDHRLKIQDIYFEEAPNTSIIIAQAITKPNRLDIIIEKGTELGMDEIWLYPGELSEKTEISQTLMKRLETIAQSAMKQSGRLHIPKIKVKTILKLWKTPLDYQSFFGDTDPSAPSFISHWNKQSFIFFVGPEKGFSKNETEHLRTLGSQGVKLHQNILRTETAPLALLSIAKQLLI
jgi:16S rRNA (uracil1498-N3)-methyltransferase